MAFGDSVQLERGNDRAYFMGVAVGEVNRNGTADRLAIEYLQRAFLQWERSKGVKRRTIWVLESIG